MFKAPFSNLSRKTLEINKGTLLYNNRSTQQMNLNIIFPHTPSNLHSISVQCLDLNLQKSGWKNISSHHFNTRSILWVVNQMRVSHERTGIMNHSVEVCINPVLFNFFSFLSGLSQHYLFSRKDTFLKVPLRHIWYFSYPSVVRKWICSKKGTIRLSYLNWFFTR